MCVSAAKRIDLEHPPSGMATGLSWESRQLGVAEQGEFFRIRLEGASLEVLEASLARSSCCSKHRQAVF